MKIEKFDYIFGANSSGGTELERAKTSTNLYVRSQDHLAFWNPKSTGRKLTAFQALKAFGINTLEEVLERGSAIITCAADQPATTLRNQREALGINILDLAKRTGMSQAEIQDYENQTKRSPIQGIERVAASLGLDERLISFLRGAGGDGALAVRLKSLGNTQSLNPNAVLALSEAAWVIRTQSRLEHDLGNDDGIDARFQPSDMYGDSNYPAWQHGYYLANRTREILNLTDEEPINSLRDVCEKLGIPLLHTELPRAHAGATVGSDGARGIVVNIKGSNQNVWVQRATIAHELGHLLWDPDEKLQKVRVDTYAELENLSTDRNAHDFVEARANAFAIAFLAPLNSVKTEYSKHSDHRIGMRSVMEKFGISYTAAKYQIWNAFDRSINFDELCVDDVEPTVDWSGREAFTDDYFPTPSTTTIRRGRFAGLVVKSESHGLISEDTACAYLQTDLDSYKNARNNIASLYQI
jgi:Zn-dependent peptidase ImmA (M78 family)/transcriptional regulator with XRE-family HTH domain